MDIVADGAAADRAVALIAHAPWAAVDCEADSLHHYTEKLCLFQVSIPGHDFIFDPLSGAGLEAASGALAARPLIFHGADFDIRMLKRSYGFHPRAGIFDTMLAAQLLGSEGQGLADLARHYCGVTLVKSGQKADWSRRPLTAALLEYASNDTRYLHAIRTEMESELRALGRLGWLHQACDRLLNYLATAKEDAPDPGTRWQIKGSKELKDRALTLLKALWEWREAEAQNRDRPSFKVFHGEDLIHMAKWASAHAHPPDITHLPNAPRSVKREARLLNAVIREAWDAPAAHFQTKPPAKHKRWTDRMHRHYLKLKELREAKAKELKIQPSLLGTNATLEAIVSAAPGNFEALSTLSFLMPWQIDVMGDDILSVLSAN